MYNEKEYKKYYYQNHKEEILKKRKENYLKNRIDILESQKEYHKIHSKEYSKRAMKYNKNHPEYIKNYQKTLKFKEYKKEYERNKRRTNINFKISRNLRTRIWSVLKGKLKSEHTLELLGCSIKQLKEHLHIQFRLGMSWSNYGKWEVDHIRPCSNFNLSKTEEQYKCFNYTNLQPLWEKDNLAKSDKY